MTVLLTRRADTLRSHTGQIAFPGGRLRSGRDALGGARCARREEEIGLTARPRHARGPLVAPTRPAPATTSPRWSASSRRAFASRPTRDEVADVFEAPFAFLMDPNNHERQFREQADGLRRYFYAMPSRGPADLGRHGRHAARALRAALRRAGAQRMSEAASLPVQPWMRAPATTGGDRGAGGGGRRRLRALRRRLRAQRHPAASRSTTSTSPPP